MLQLRTSPDAVKPVRHGGRAGRDGGREVRDGGYEGRRTVAGVAAGGVYEGDVLGVMRQDEQPASLIRCGHRCGGDSWATLAPQVHAKPPGPTQHQLPSM